MRIFPMAGASDMDVAMNKGDITRQRIIATAAPIFNQRGFAGCSMQDIMEATGLEKGGLYRHFQSKEELATEALSYALARSVRSRTDDLKHIDGALAKLRFAVQRFVETPSLMPGGCPLMNTAIDTDDGNLALRKLAQTGLSNWKKRLAVIVNAGRRSGEIRADVEARQIANTMIATLEGALMISRLEGSKQALLDARISLEVLLNCIAANS
jgi:TetR/AcrR family transcriptional repressor of nem operon